MILTRTPLRVSFCGGGSDIGSFYTKHGGCVVSTTIDKYVYLSLQKMFNAEYTLLKYSASENVSSIDQIKHPIFRESLKKYGLESLELTSMADVPAGTGLGSSSSFTVGLTNLLRTYVGQSSSSKELAEEACDMEINRLNEPIGKQDQYAAAYGGLNMYRFEKDGSVEVSPVRLSDSKKKELNDNLIMFYTGKSRSASQVLEEQKKNISQGLAESNQIKMCKLAEEMYDCLNKDDIQSFGNLLDDGWKLKKTLASGISNPDLDAMYDVAMDNGAFGGKLLGAGGGGFMLFYTPADAQDKIISAMSNYKKMPMRFENSGSMVVYNDYVRR